MSMFTIPKTRIENFLAKIAHNPNAKEMEPKTRKEKFLNEIAEATDTPNLPTPDASGGDTGKVPIVQENGGYALGVVASAMVDVSYMFKSMGNEYFDTSYLQELVEITKSKQAFAVRNNRFYFVVCVKYSYGDKYLIGLWNLTYFGRNPGDPMIPTISVQWSAEITSQTTGNVGLIQNNTLSRLPYVTASDNGKILKVVDGAWAAVDPA